VCDSLTSTRPIGSLYLRSNRPDMWAVGWLCGVTLRRLLRLNLWAWITLPTCRLPTVGSYLSSPLGTSPTSVHHWPFSLDEPTRRPHLRLKKKEAAHEEMGMGNKNQIIRWRLLVENFHSHGSARDAANRPAPPTRHLLPFRPRP